jgi:glucosamine--fructose-6-phosphate aminotransferase (isomerizing)
MCGIIGYIGNRQAEAVLLEGLRRLEYRGYDSAGAVTVHDGDLKLAKALGRVAVLEDRLARQPLPGQIGIAHTRWATHGQPSDTNSHPHLDCQGSVALVHNGIIENHEELRATLEKRGHTFRSDTDSEVLAHLIEEQLETRPFDEAFLAALRQVVGTFGVAVVSAHEPEKLFVARRGSPLVIGIGPNGERLVASDAAAILAHTRDAIWLDDDEAAVLSLGGCETFSLNKDRRVKEIETISWSLDEIERGNYPHFMLKEIHETPDVVANACRGRLNLTSGRAVLGGLQDYDQQLRQLNRITMTACGSAYLAGVIGSRMIEECSGLPIRTELASELRYRRFAYDPNHEALLTVSQSGETADTLSAMREAQHKGVLSLGIVNVVGSTIARESQAGIYSHAGPEIAVASTKTFLAQLTVFSLLALYFGRQRQMSQAAGIRLAEELLVLPDKIQRVLNQEERIAAIARKYAAHPSMLFLGRGYNAPLASEGALKLKEIAYVHAEGYPAGEMKHGPIALLDDHFPAFAICTKDSVYEKNRSNLEEVRARQAPLIIMGSEGDDGLLRLSDDIIFVPRTIEMLSPILNAVPLQLFAYHAAVARGLDPDKPRNLAKSVTVE